MNIIAAREVLLTSQHLAIGMEYASGGNLTAYVTSRWPRAQSRSKLFLSEDEARYYFRVRAPHPARDIRADVYHPPVTEPMLLSWKLSPPTCLP